MSDYSYSRPGRSLLRRVLVLALFFGLLAFAALIARLYRLQITQHEELEARSLAQQLRETPTSAERGAIYDRNGAVLAVSASVDNVYLSPAEIDQYGEDRELIADGLSGLLGLDRETILEKSRQSGSWYVTVKRKIEREEADALRRFLTEHSLRGVHLEPDTRRYYPNGSLACHVIGFVGTDNTGLEGLEARYDSALSGTPGVTRRSSTAFGTALLYGAYSSFEAGEDGSSLITTLDTAIQYYVEKQLKQAVEDYDVQNGAGAIVMDVNTGGILAMASLDSYDLNDFLSVSEKDRARIDAASSEEEKQALLLAAQNRQWRNKALSDTYEPGSTFKILTLSMALESGAVRPDDGFYCGGSVKVLGRSSAIRCWKDGGHGSQTLTQAVQHSCNAAFVNIGLRVGAETFYEYCEAFGLLHQSSDPDESLTASTGIDLYGESGSIWWSKNVFCSPKNLSQLAAASFGQTFTVTPLQMITAVSACVNGGRLYEPYVVSKVVSGDGSLSYEHRPALVRQVISEETSRTVREILEQVVGDPKDGTGHNAAVAGYRIGGKTGTSEKVSLEAQTGQKEYIVSFVGFAPADDPQLAILVFLDTPSTETGIYISGGQMAAPVVGRMFSDILPYLGLEPHYSELEEQRQDRPVPSLKGLDRSQAASVLSEAGFSLRLLGEGETVTDQLPSAGVTVAAGSQILVYCGAAPSEERETVPRLSELSYEEARDVLARLGLFIRTSSVLEEGGRQMVSTQSLRPGVLAEHGSVISVSLIDRDEALLGRY